MSGISTDYLFIKNLRGEGDVYLDEKPFSGDTVLETDAIDS
jgi:hypothetical protein